ncbi:hypothetical protein ACQCVK_05105 [Rossellomorea vietnamensis]|uniref:hypothetical protein n=1 Tax=Rossellomorea vietnamensis TaxID=218284 RepID=UPI003CF438E7
MNNNLIEFKLAGDLIKDRLGNWYYIISQHKEKLILVNAVVYNTFKRFLKEEYIEAYKDQRIGQPATDMLERSIDKIMAGKVPLKIYILEELERDGYEIVVDGLYYTK